MGDWRHIIGDDLENDDKLALEIYHKDKLVCMVRSKKTGISLTWFEEDIDIPFDWFFEVMQIAKDKVK